MDELIEAQISSKDELMDLMNEGEKQRHGKHLRLFPNLGIFYPNSSPDLYDLILYIIV